ncbi:hypothetical protein Tco_0209481 [Tanacetum coccineum]
MEIIKLELEFYTASQARARNINLGQARVEFRARVLVFKSSSSLAVLGSTRLVYTHMHNAVQNQGTQNGLSVVPRIANQHGNGNVVAAGNSNKINENQIRCYNRRGEGHYASNYTVKPRKMDDAYLQTQLQIAQKDEVGIQLNSEEFDFMAAAGAYDEIEKVNANYNLQDNLQQASTSGTQSDKAPIYDSNGSAENDSNVISAASSVEQSGGTVEQHPANVEESRVLYDLLYNNLAIEVEKRQLPTIAIEKTRTLI